MFAEAISAVATTPLRPGARPLFASSRKVGNQVVVRSITITAAVGERHVAQDPRRTPEFESMHDESRHGRKPTVAAPVRGRICAAALLVSDDGRYLMQHRDALPSINFPDHWCCFGGGIEPGETAEAALRRELREEIDYEAGSITPFTEYQVVLPIKLLSSVRFPLYI